MKKSTCLFLFLAALLVWNCSLPAVAQPGNAALLQPYLTALKSLGQNCEMHYVSSAQTGTAPAVSVTGHLAMAGENYYDSSSNRFYFRNEKWVIQADHARKWIYVLYLPKWEAQMGKGVTLASAPGALFPNADLSAFSNIRVVPAGKDSIQVFLRCTTGTQAVMDMELFYKKGSFIPSRYRGTLTAMPQPDILEGKTVASPKTVCAFSCYNIQPQASKGLFDDSRLVLVQGKTAQLRRYNDYKTYRRSN